MSVQAFCLLLLARNPRRGLRSLERRCVKLVELGHLTMVSWSFSEDEPTSGLFTVTCDPAEAPLDHESFYAKQAIKCFIYCHL
jgi:hypothetical protein